MTKTQKTMLLVGGGAVAILVTVAAVRAFRVHEDEGNEAFALVEAEAQAAKSGKQAPGPVFRPKRKSESEKLVSLHPSVRRKVERMIAKAKTKGIDLFVVSAHRGEAEQNELYSRGRTQAELNKVGLSHVKAQPDKRKVTNAKAGQSDHNVRRAVDLVEKKGRKLIWTNSRWDEIGRLGESVGLKWGGRWKRFVDKPHFYDRDGKSVAQLWREMPKADRA